MFSLETLKKINPTVKLPFYPCSQNYNNTPESKMTILPFYTEITNLNPEYTQRQLITYKHI